MKNRITALFLILALCLAVCAAAVADPSEEHTMPDSAVVSFSEIVRAETVAGEDGEEFPVWYLPVEGSQLTYKAGPSAPGLLIFAYDSWEECIADSENRKLYNLIGPNQEGTLDFEKTMGEITWPDNVCFKFVVLGGGSWITDNLVFRFETADDMPPAA